MSDREFRLADRAQDFQRGTYLNAVAEDKRRYQQNYNQALRQFNLTYSRSAFESDRAYKEAKRQWTDAFVRQKFESDRDYYTAKSQWSAAYNRQVYEADRAYKRSAFESDRAYNRSALESDRAYNRSAFESDRAYNRQKYEWENSLINYVNQAKKAGLHPLFALGGSASMGGGTYMPGSFGSSSYGGTSYGGSSYGSSSSSGSPYGAGSLPGGSGAAPNFSGGSGSPPQLIPGQSNTGSFARDGANAVGLGVAQLFSSLGGSLSQAYQQSKDAELVDAQVLAYKASAQRDLAQAQAFNSRSSLNQEQATVSPRPAQEIGMNPQKRKKTVTMKQGYSTFKSRPGDTPNGEIVQQFGMIRGLGAEVTDIAKSAWEQYVAGLAEITRSVRQFIGR